MPITPGEMLRITAEPLKEASMVIQSGSHNRVVSAGLAKLRITCGVALVGVAGCVLPPSYQPPRPLAPPVSVSDSVPSGETPPRGMVLIIHRDGDAPSGTKADVLPPPRAEADKVGSPKGGKEGEDKAATLPPPRLPAPTGMSFHQVILACLHADPKIHAGMEQIHQVAGRLRHKLAEA